MAKKSNSRLGSSEFVRWFRPLIDCLQELGAARPREASDWIAEKERIPSEQREASLKSGEERFHNQVQFARQYLVWEGLNDGGKKGIWSLTPLGARTRLNDEEARSICRKWVKFHAAARTGTKGKNENYTPSTSSPVAVDLHPDERTEDVGLLNVLRGLSATGFEHFCRHLLLDYEFEKVTVTKRSGDDGIDGVGILQLNPLVSSVVVFQCKRYLRSVGREDVSLLRSDAQQRADKAIFITTGSLTRQAKEEAVRVIPHIELIDGEQLVAMCEAKQIGMTPRVVFDIEHAFFAPFRALSRVLRQRIAEVRQKIDFPV